MKKPEVPEAAISAIFSRRTARSSADSVTVSFAPTKNGTEATVSQPASASDALWRSSRLNETGSVRRARRPWLSTAVVVSTPQDTENDHSFVMAKTPAYEFNEEYFGRYDVKTEFAYIRDGGSTSFQAIGILPYGVKVYNYGFYSLDDRGVKWYLVESEYYFGIKYIGFMSEKVLVYYGREKTVHE